MKLILCTFFFLFFLAILAPARAEVLVVGISTGYPPYYFKENGTLTGLCIEIINIVSRKIGIEIIFKEYPWKRLMLSAKRGDVDAIMPLFKTKEREEFLNFNGLELAFEKIHFFTAKSSTASYKGSLDGLSAYSIGVVANYSYGSKFDSFKFPKKLITINDKHLIEMFMHNRFDIGVGNKYVVHHYADLAGIAETIRFLDPPISQDMLYLGFAKEGNKYNLSNTFAEALQAYKTTVDYLQLTEKYGISGKD